MNKIDMKTLDEYAKIRENLHGFFREYYEYYNPFCGCEWQHYTVSIGEVVCATLHKKLPLNFQDAVIVEVDNPPAFKAIFPSGEELFTWRLEGAVKDYHEYQTAVKRGFEKYKEIFEENFNKALSLAILTTGAAE